MLRHESSAERRKRKRFSVNHIVYTDAFNGSRRLIRERGSSLLALSVVSNCRRMGKQMANPNLCNPFLCRRGTASIARGKRNFIPVNVCSCRLMSTAMDIFSTALARKRTRVRICHIITFPLAAVFSTYNTTQTPVSRSLPDFDKARG